MAERETNQKPGYKNVDPELLICRDDRGRIRWSLPGNTDEENLQMGVRNIQGLFLQKFPEFLELFAFDENRHIVEEKREEAEEFILKRIGKTKDFRVNIGNTPLDRETAPYFHGSHIVAVKETTVVWGVKSNPHKDSKHPLKREHYRRWNLPGNTEEENLQMGIRNIQQLFLEKYPEFLELFPFGTGGKIAPEKRQEATDFIKERILSSYDFVNLFSSAPTRRKSTPYFHGRYLLALEKSFSSWGIKIDSSNGNIPLKSLRGDTNWKELFESNVGLGKQYIQDVVRPFIDNKGTIKINAAIKDAIENYYPGGMGGLRKDLELYVRKPKGYWKVLENIETDTSLEEQLLEEYASLLEKGETMTFEEFLRGKQDE